jgi:hypothetical protein
MPVAYTDPFGLTPDTLQYTSEDAKQAVDKIRQQDKRVDKTFEELDKSPNRYVVHFTTEWIISRGVSFPSPGAQELPEYAALFPGHKGIIVVNPDRSRHEGFAPGFIAFHEATHLLGVERRGWSYGHTDCAFRTVVNVGIDLKQPAETDVNPSCK